MGQPFKNGNETRSYLGVEIATFVPKLKWLLTFSLPVSGASLKQCVVYMVHEPHQIGLQTPQQRCSIHPKGLHQYGC
jgi:hypothetical protein